MAIPGALLASKPYLREGLYKFQQTKYKTDFKIICNGETFETHAIVFAAVSKTAQDLINTGEEHISLPSHYAEIIPQFIKFMYTEQIWVSPQRSDQYQV